MNVNPFLLGYLKSNLAFFVLLQGGPLTVAILHLLDRRKTHHREEDELLACYWVGSLLPLAGLGKAGASQNYWIELAAITAVLATLGIRARLVDSSVTGNLGRALVPVLLLAATLAPVAARIGAYGAPVMSQVWPSTSYASGLDRVIERVRSEPRDVIAEPADVIVLAGRRILLEPAHPLMVLGQGSWSPSPVVLRICRGDVGLLILGYPLESGGPEFHGYLRWPAPILAALRETMVLEAKDADRFLYAWREPSEKRACAGQTS
jgi:hypothetical protein